MEAGIDAEIAPMPSVRDWSELPLDALAFVFGKLGAIEVLLGASLVCHSWLEAAKVPDVWRSVDMAHHEVVDEMEENIVSIFEPKHIDGDDLCAMAKVAVARSGGQLVVFLGKKFVTDELLKYIGDRSGSLKSLSLISCDDVSNKGFTELITKCPLLEDLLLEFCPKVGGRGVYEATGKACPQLRRFSLQELPYSFNFSGQMEEVLGITAMRELRSLSLHGSNVNNNELAAVLDGCPHLDTLCLHHCRNVVADSALRAKCDRIKTLALTEYESDSDQDTQWLRLDFDSC